jgi:hypothetical protein
MGTKFSQFNAGGNIVPGDIVVGLRNGQDYQFNAPSLSTVAWNTISVSQALAYDNGYFCTNVLPITLTLPAAFPFGAEVIITNVAGGQVTIAQQAGQQIQIGPNLTTLGAGGSIKSTTAGDSIVLVCFQLNVFFITEGAPQGIWTIT